MSIPLNRMYEERKKQEYKTASLNKIKNKFIDEKEEREIQRQESIDRWKRKQDADNRLDEIQKGIKARI